MSDGSLQLSHEFPLSLGYWTENQEALEEMVKTSMKNYSVGEADRMVLGFHEIMNNIAQSSLNGHVTLHVYDCPDGAEAYLRAPSEKSANEISGAILESYLRIYEKDDKTTAQNVCDVIAERGHGHAGLGARLILQHLDVFRVDQLNGKEVEYVLIVNRNSLQPVHSTNLRQQSL